MDTLKPLATVETSTAGEMVSTVVSLSASFSLSHTHTHTLLPHFSLFLALYVCFVHNFLSAYAVFLQETMVNWVMVTMQLRRYQNSSVRLLEK